MKTLFLTLLLTLALAVPALAQGPSQDGYITDGPQAVEQTGGDGGDSANASANDPVAAQSADSGSLPFTGMDLVLVAVFGAGLLSVGVGMRRLTRPADPASF